MTYRRPVHPDSLKESENLGLRAFVNKVSLASGKQNSTTCMNRDH